MDFPQDKFVVVNAKGEPVHVLHDDEKEATSTKLAMERVQAHAGPWSIHPSSDLEEIIGPDGNPMLIIPKRYWN